MHMNMFTELHNMVKQPRNVPMPTSSTVLLYWNYHEWRAAFLEMLCKEVRVFLQTEYVHVFKKHVYLCITSLRSTFNPLPFPVSWR